MAKQVSKLNTAWIAQTRKYFLEFLIVTKFPHPQRNGERGSRFAYPEWLIMFIAVLAVKCHVKSYVGSHQVALRYWGPVAADLDLPPISESQLRERLKKSAIHMEDLQPIKTVSADKMMTKALGPVWHQKQRKQGVIPAGLTGLDRDATWSYSQAEGWVYGHGTFCVVSHQKPVLGLFHWMPNAAHEAKRLRTEIVRFAGVVKKVCMDSKADDQKLYTLLKREHQMQLLTVPRHGMDKTPARQAMIQEMRTPGNRRTYRQRATTVEPMPGLVKERFALQTCRLRGDASNRWLFAAMGVAVQLAQRQACHRGTSTWNIKEEVLGL
jgi:hypothetical protein